MKNIKPLALLGGAPLLKKPLVSLSSIGREEKATVLKVLNSKVLSGYVGRWGERFYGGPFVRQLEKDFCKYFKIKYAVAFNSATTALQAAVAALGIGPGDEVITTPYTMSATPAAILFNNAVPVFADIDENTFCIDPKSIEQKITKKTKAIMAVNLFGRAADVQEILRIAKKHNLKVIEDNAQSAGATIGSKFLGTIADIGVFSLNSNKVIQCGEGGVLVTDNKEYAFRAQLMMNHGEAVTNDKYKIDKSFEPILGNNFRMTELQAAVAVEQLKKLKVLNQKRIALADYLTKKLEKFSWLQAPKTEKNQKHVYFTYGMRFFAKELGINRALFKQAMAAEGLVVVEGYQEPIYLFPLYQQRRMFAHSQFPFVSKEFESNIAYPKGLCPVAERMFAEELLLTNICQSPQTKKEIDLFVKGLEKIEQNIEALKNYKA